MFIRKSKLDSIISRLKYLERRTDRHGKFLHNDYEALAQHKEKIDELLKAVGEDDRSGWDLSALAHLMYGGGTYRETKELTLTEKVKQIMQHLGLITVHTPAETKLAVKAKKTVKKAISKKKASK